MQSARPVVFSRLFGVFNIINFVLFGFRDNLFTQNHSYNLLSWIFALGNRFSTFESDKYKEVSSAKDNIFSLDDFAISLT